MKYEDIEQFIPGGGYQVNVPLGHIEATLTDFAQTKGDNLHGLDLDPDFQRDHVWTEDKQRAYVEFLLRGGQSSRTLHFNCPGWMASFKGPLQLVDGKQRLEAVRKFLRNELRILAKPCGDIFATSGVILGDFSFEDQRIILRRHTLIFAVNNLPTRAEVLKWYLQLNTGGVVHTEEEIAKVQRMLNEERECQN